MSHQPLPAAGVQREALRAKGQFWTPDWVADAMVGYALGGGAPSLFDPAVGAGAFLRAAKRVGARRGWTPRLLGREIDGSALQQARETGLTEEELAHVRLADFVLDPPDASFPAIVANPPYLRHHRLSPTTKGTLRQLGAELLGEALDGRAGLHVYFLLRALQRLEVDGRLAFILPADICEGVFAAPLWQWLTRHFRLEAVVAFSATATPFPGVDTNPLVFLIRHAPPRPDFWWVTCQQPCTNELYEWVRSGFQQAGKTMRVTQRTLAEGLATGLSRAPAPEGAAGPPLGDFAKVMRGIATGANDFFLLTRAQTEALELPDDFLLPVVGRTRDVPDNEITHGSLTRLDAAGRPTRLFSPDGRPLAEFPPSVRRYLERGAEEGLPFGALLAQRTPWYRMERREPPPFLFAYLGRRNSRFICNTVGAMPLTAFLCVYPRERDPLFVARLWQVLSHPATLANLPLVGKSYGCGAIKVEPRSLERLPLPRWVLDEVGLPDPTPMGQLPLCPADGLG